MIDFRKPSPGSETLYYINNPYAVFGDFEIEKAMQLFGQYDYSGAKEKLEELREKVPDPVAYQNMDALVTELRRDVRVNFHFLLMDCIGILKEQLDILDALKEIQKLFRSKNHMAVLRQQEYSVPLMFTMQTNALIREAQKKYDSATLLLYRLLEMIEQRRLSHYDIDVSKAEFSSMKYDEEKMPMMKGITGAKRLDIYKEEIAEIKAIALCGPSAK